MTRFARSRLPGVDAILGFRRPVVANDYNYPDDPINGNDRSADCIHTSIHGISDQPRQ
jgi:hypothetical protein